MANIKTTIGNQGVISQTTTGSPTLNVSVPVNLTSPAVASGNISTNTTNRVDIYVSDIYGNDTNSGLTSTAPLKTLAAAQTVLKSIARIIAHDIIIHVGAHAGAGYTWATISGFTLVDGARIFIYGDGAGQSGEDGFVEVVASSVALAGSDNTKVVGSGFVADAYLGNTIEILTGNAAGDRRTIKENTTTDILSPTTFTAAIAPGDSYRIVRPAVKIAFTGTFSTSSTVICSGLSNGIKSGKTATTFASVSAARSALVLVNLRYGVAASSTEIYNSTVQMFGVEFYGGGISAEGELDFGVTAYQRADLLALVSASTTWHGWAVSQVAGTGAAMYCFGAALRTGVYVGKALIVTEGHFDLYAGRLVVTGSTNALSVGYNQGVVASLTLGTYGIVATNYLGVKIQSVTGYCIGVSMGKINCFGLAPAAPVVLVSTSGIGILIDHASVLDMSSQHNTTGGFSLTTGGWGISVKHGGQAIVDHDMSDYVIASLGAFTLDQLTAIPAGALNGVGKYMRADDGSTIISAD